VFKKILIANRGEIAVRIIRACSDMGVRTVAVYSEVDRDAPHVRLADQAFAIGPAQAAESYLNIDKILAVAETSGAEAIHPGYGFLAENADFAERCVEAGFVFIGPSAASIRAMGDKVEARRRMIDAGVPVSPGTGEFSGGAAEALLEAEKIGFPVIIKAAAGGGGKGMRVVESADELETSLERARSESRASFGDDTVYIEKFITRPRHIEVQVLVDGQGHGIAAGERECSIQRRHQKLIEETPSPVVDADTRRRLGEMALAAAASCDYVGAGTVEFLRDADGSFYFMEMNTRLQVEHPVTEEVYGIDIVVEQIRIAAGEKLSYSQDQMIPRGHAVECRITAEDPSQNFMPCPGRIEAVRVATGPGIRDDSAVAPGYEIPVHYDPMIGKLIAHGKDRDQALRRMDRALAEYRLDGITTNMPFLRRVLRHEAFVAGDLHTGFIDEHHDDLFSERSRRVEDIALLAAAIHAHHCKLSASARGSGTHTQKKSRWLEVGRSRALRGG